jgi:hypothetical protein
MRALKVCLHPPLSGKANDSLTNVTFPGRAAAIAADKLSFDLSDDPEGKSGGNVLSDPEYLKLFGYGPSGKTPESKAEASVEAPQPPQGTTVQVPAAV